MSEHAGYYSGEFIIDGDTTTVGAVDISAVNANYLASVDPGEGNLTLQNIIEQKYIAMYNDPEIFADWRRTGFPELTPNTGDMIPRRLPYPQTETVSNENTPSQADVTMFSRVWWDQ